jgi:hypothetical protein
MQSLELTAENIFLLSSSAHSQTIASIYQLNYLQVPIYLENNIENKQNYLATYQQWLVTQIETYQIDEIYIDVFPAGLYGEWNHIEILLENSRQKPIFYWINRRLQWKNYVKLLDMPPFFAKSFILEDLEDEHFAFVQQHSQEISQNFPKLHYTYPIATEIPTEIVHLWQNNTPYWLLIHAEPYEELLVLLAYTVDKYQISNSNAKIIILSTINTQKIYNYLQSFCNNIRISIKTFQILPTFTIPIFLLEKAEKICTACGFNSMQQTEKYANKHFFIPFERRFDDQFWRASQRNKLFTNN